MKYKISREVLASGDPRVPQLMEAAAGKADTFAELIKHDKLFTITPGPQGDLVTYRDTSAERRTFLSSAYHRPAHDADGMPMQVAGIYGGGACVVVAQQAAPAGLDTIRQRGGAIIAVNQGIQAIPDPDIWVISDPALSTSEPALGNVRTLTLVGEGELHRRMAAADLSVRWSRIWECPFHQHTGVLPMFQQGIPVGFGLPDPVALGASMAAILGFDVVFLCAGVATEELRQAYPHIHAVFAEHGVRMGWLEGLTKVAPVYDHRTVLRNLHATQGPTHAPPKPPPRRRELTEGQRTYMDATIHLRRNMLLAGHLFKKYEEFCKQAPAVFDTPELRKSVEGDKKSGCGACKQKSTSPLARAFDAALDDPTLVAAWKNIYPNEYVWNRDLEFKFPPPVTCVWFREDHQEAAAKFRASQEK